MSKVMTGAISKFVKSGDWLFISGAQHGEPSAAVHETVRRKIDNLSVVSCLVNTQQIHKDGIIRHQVDIWGWSLRQLGRRIYPRTN